MAPHCKRGDSGTASKPKRSDDVFIGEKVKILEIMEVGGKKGGGCGDCQVVLQEQIFHL